jgi:hypothetical protein
MSKKIAISLILIIVLSAFIVFNQTNSIVAAEAPTNLKLYIGPTSVLADNSTYNCIFVQLQDSAGKPARALQDTLISLSSFSTTIGTVDPSVIIPKGATYISANFKSTFAPGSTSIAAAATGFSTVQSTITTIGPIPSAIAVYGFPSTLPADGGSYDAIMVQLQDSSGSPAKAPKQGIQVTLSSSNTNIGTVSPSVTIPEGQTYAIATFNTKLVEGPVIVTAIAQNYAVGQTTIITQNIAPSASQLKINVGPTKILADKNSYTQIAIQLQDGAGHIANATSDISVTIASSDESIGKIQSPIIIQQNKTYALATITTTYKAGTTTITTVATNLLADHQSISTFGFIPSKIAVYVIPSILPSDKGVYKVIQVQLQDSQGRPAKDPETDVNINLFSSQPSVAGAISALTIPFGKTQAPGSLTVTNAAGSTTITAQAPGYTTGEGTVTTYLIDFAPLQITATATPGSLNNAETSVILLHITADGLPVLGATVSFTVTPSAPSGNAFTAVTEVEAGTYNTTFTAPSFTKTTTCTITASASKTGYLSAQATTTVTVQPITSPTPTPAATPDPETSPSPAATPVINNLGNIQISIKDINDNPLNDTIVSSIIQPAGMPSLLEITNSTGYVTFKNVTVGSYVFLVNKAGYSPMNATIEFTGQPMTLAVTLSDSSSNAPGDYALLIVASVVSIAIIAAALSGYLFVKRRKSTRFKALRDLQKQLKNKNQ